jgi:DNA (cytosine-5)-methyltransferase 1
MQPRLCFFENVEGHISLGLREVISELESIGYKATWGIFSASEVGAPHRRKRIFIMAYTMRYGSSESWNVCQRPDGQEFSGNGQQRGIDARVSDTMCEGLPGQREVPSRIESKLRDISHNSWWASERGLGRMAHGDSYWVDRLRLCGNGVVPATATLAFQTLLKRL